jgi:taurine dioxygenase
MAMGMTIRPMRAALGAVVEGLDATVEIERHAQQELVDAWNEHSLLFFPEVHLTPEQQVRLAGVFGPQLAATTESAKDNRNIPTLRDEGFPQVLVLDSTFGDPGTTAVWHTDVTFVDNPPIGSLFCMESPAPSGGDTMWISQRRAYAALSEPIKMLIGGLSAVHGRAPHTSTSEHPIVKYHDGNGLPHLFVNRGWTAAINGLSSIEARHLLNLLVEHSEKPEFQVRWQWSAGDAVLWDNRCTMHYAVYDYGTEFRRARRVTIYNNAP